MAAVCRQTSSGRFPLDWSLTLYIAATHFRVRATSDGSNLTRENIMTNTTLEQDLQRVSDLLRCAAATAYESSDQLTGQKRDLAFSVVHLVEIAQGLVERSLVGVETI